MDQRNIERLGRSVSVIGLGTWQLGADWGSVAAEDARATLEAAVEDGVTFFDTADVYGDGRSEEFCGELHRRHPELLIATKMGRRVEQVPENYNRRSFLEWNDRSRANLGVEQLDLVQLHCPPDAVFENDAVFEALDEMVSTGRIRAYGVSVETCAQAHGNAASASSNHPVVDQRPALDAELASVTCPPANAYLLPKTEGLARSTIKA
jgi:aryl-alcohol dehydrogenase-like predicted oxidoreductase